MTTRCPGRTSSPRSATPTRVDVVVAAFVAQRLGWTTLGDPVQQVVPLVLGSMISGSYVIGTHRLLERLDSLVAREWVAQNGEDAPLAVISRLDDRVRGLTYQRDQTRAAQRAADDTNASCELGLRPPSALEARTAGAQAPPPRRIDLSRR